MNYPPQNNQSYYAQSNTPSYGQTIPQGGYFDWDTAVQGTKYEPVGIGGWIGVFLLMCLPVVNLILLIVWACGGATKQSLVNFARAFLILALIGLVIGVILAVAAGSVFGAVLSDLGSLGSLGM